MAPISQEVAEMVRIMIAPRPQPPPSTGVRVPPGDTTTADAYREFTEDSGRRGVPLAFGPVETDRTTGRCGAGRDYSDGHPEGFALERRACLRGGAER